MAGIEPSPLAARLGDDLGAELTASVRRSATADPANVNSRGKRSIALALTPEEQAYLERCRSALRAIETVEEELRVVSAGTGGQLRLTTSVDIAQAFLPPVIGPFFRDAYPTVAIDLIWIKAKMAPLRGWRQGASACAASHRAVTGAR